MEKCSICGRGTARQYQYFEAVSGPGRSGGDDSVYGGFAERRAFVCARCVYLQETALYLALAPAAAVAAVVFDQMARSDQLFRYLSILLVLAAASCLVRGIGCLVRWLSDRPDTEAGAAAAIRKLHAGGKNDRGMVVFLTPGQLKALALRMRR